MDPYSSLDGLLVGPPKTATTWLAKQLRDHEDILCPSEDAFLTLKRPSSQESLLKKYTKQDDYTCVLNYATTYSYFETIPDKIASWNPDVKIIFTVRDPIQRAISNIRHDWRLGFVSRRYPAIDILNPYILKDRYIEPGRYDLNVKRWADAVGPENVYLFPFPGHVDDPIPHLFDLLEFLGVQKDGFDVDTSPTYETKTPLIPGIHYRAHHGRKQTKLLLGPVDWLNTKLGERFVSQHVDKDAKEAIRDEYQNPHVGKEFERLAKEQRLRGESTVSQWSF